MTKTKTQQYPRFISNRPCGIDKFTGGSQKRLANSIADHIINNDNGGEMPRIIGIEGGWGAGKSNVVQQLKNIEKINGSYHFFEYDAWGHQEDLQRRSLLEIMTDELIRKKILKGKVDIVIKGGETLTVTWPEKLKYLLARKTEVITEKYPKITYSALATILTIIFTPISVLIAFNVECKIFGKIMIGMLPIIGSLIAWLIAACKNKNYRNPSYLLAVYQDKIEKDVTYETISEDEPTVREFKSWMNDVSNSLSDNKNKLVIVFDNMDRLPAEKVKELWSSIHTFFAEEGFENVWAIIPFDQAHLACAFGNTEKDETKELTRYFISKTFPIVYRVSAPVVTDYKEIINKLLAEAFGDIESEEFVDINRAYRLTHLNPNVRNIIVFINELVALEQQWNDCNISLLNKAIYILHREEIQKNPVAAILSGDYLNKITDIVSNNGVVQAQIASLAYGIEIEHAKQIPLTKYLNSCVTREIKLDINKYSDNKNFNNVLEEVIKNLDNAHIDNAIIVLDTLNEDAVTRVDTLWKSLLKRRTAKSQNKQEFNEIDEILLKHIQPTQKQELIIKICNEIQSFEKCNGTDYWNSLSQLEQFIAKHCPDCNIQLKDLEVTPEVFVAYVEQAKIEVAKYKLRTPSRELDIYITGLLPENLNSNLVRLLAAANYELPSLVPKIEEMKKAREIRFNNFDQIIDTYKHLVSDRPINILADVNEAISIHRDYVVENENQDTPSDGYYDIVAILLSYHQNVNDTTEETIEGVSKVILNYFSNIQELIDSILSYSSYPLSKKIVEYLIDNNISSELQASILLQKYSTLKSTFDLHDETLLNYINDNNTENLSETITQTNIQTVIKEGAAPIIYELAAKSSNTLSTHIYTIALNSRPLKT